MLRGLLAWVLVTSVLGAAASAQTPPEDEGAPVPEAPPESADEPPAEQTPAEDAPAEDAPPGDATPEDATTENAAPSPEDVARETAFRALIAEALAEYQAGNWAEARALFFQAHRVRSSANAVRLGAVCAYELREYPSAVRGFEEALAMTERPLSEQQRREANEGLGRALRFLGTVELAVSPAGAVVKVDGVVTAPDERGRFFLTPGTHEIRVEAPDHEPHAQRVSYVGGERERLAIALEETPEPVIIAPPPAEAARPVMTAEQRRAQSLRREQIESANRYRIELQTQADAANARYRRRLKWGRFFVTFGAISTFGAVGLRFYADYDENADRAVAAGCAGCASGNASRQENLRSASGPLLGIGVAQIIGGAALIYAGKRVKRVADANLRDDAGAQRELGCSPLGAGLTCRLSF
ncbi:MAG: hypothetical protein AAGH15_22125 [Myxococcota bacterium]